MNAKASREDSDFRSHGFRREALAVIDAKATPAPFRRIHGLFAEPPGSPLTTQTTGPCYAGPVFFFVRSPSKRYFDIRDRALFKKMEFLVALLIVVIFVGAIAGGKSFGSVVSRGIFGLIIIFAVLYFWLANTST